MSTQTLRAGTHTCLVAMLTMFAGCVEAPADDATTPAGPCDAFVEDGDPLLVALQNVAAVGPVWDTYSMDNHPVVLIGEGDEGQECAAVWRSGQDVQRLPIGPVSLFTPIYSFWIGDAPGPNAQSAWTAFVTGLGIDETDPALEAALREYGESRALLLTTEIDWDQLDVAAADDLHELFPDDKVLQMVMALHENYHLYSQLPAFLDQDPQYAWPTWDSQPDRDLLLERCYLGSVTQAHEVEMDLLYEAFDALYLSESPDEDAARLAAVQFITARDARFALLDGVTLPSEAGLVGCAVAEDIMEIEEGAPTYMTDSTLLQAGIRDAESIRGLYKWEHRPYYASGAMQLFVLEGLLGADAVRQLSGRIANSSAPEDGIYGEFRAAIAP